MNPQVVALSLATAIMILAPHAHARPFVYVVNSGSKNVSVIDAATNTVIAAVPVGRYPLSIAITPDGASAYVTHNSKSNNVSVIDTATNTVTTTVSVGAYPLQVAITPDGDFAYVTHYRSENVSVIDTATNAVTTTVAVGVYPSSFAFTPDGAFAYFSNSYSNKVSVVDTASNTVTATFHVFDLPLAGFRPQRFVFAPDSALAYVADPSSDQVWVICAGTNKTIAGIPVGSAPVGVAITPDGAFVYVTNDISKNVSVIDTATATVTATVPIASRARRALESLKEFISWSSGGLEVAIAPDGASAYVMNNSSNMISVIDTATNNVTANIPVGVRPSAIAIAPLRQVEVESPTLPGVVPAPNPVAVTTNTDAVTTANDHQLGGSDTESAAGRVDAEDSAGKRAKIQMSYTADRDRPVTLAEILPDIRERCKRH